MPVGSGTLTAPGSCTRPPGVLTPLGLVTPAGSTARARPARPPGARSGRGAGARQRRAPARRVAAAGAGDARGLDAARFARASARIVHVGETVTVAELVDAGAAKQAALPVAGFAPAVAPR